jgi:hypothetical protein
LVGTGTQLSPQGVAHVVVDEQLDEGGVLGGQRLVRGDDEDLEVGLTPQTPDDVDAGEEALADPPEGLNEPERVVAVAEEAGDVLLDAGGGGEPEDGREDVPEELGEGPLEYLDGGLWVRGTDRMLLFGAGRGAGRQRNPPVYGGNRGETWASTGPLRG